jgi:single-strand DNA-binding protein
MASLNKVLLIGNLTRDPEIRYIPSGTAVADIGVAVGRKWTGQDGQKHEETTFVDVTIWARSAELAGEYLHKGDPIFVEGRLQLDQWQDKEGQKRSRMRVVCERWQFLPRGGAGGRSGGGGGTGAEDRPPPPEEFGEPAPAAAGGGGGDNIPF